jgi:cytosine/adenosine deaminase-related metal-dependent hydrolase
MLSDRTVLVHGLGIDTNGASLLNRRGASLVWCPTSNRFLFGRTHTADFVSELQSVVLGSDSALTAAGDLLDEIQYAAEEAGVPAEQLYAMVTNRPAKVFRLGGGEGCFRVSGVADFIALRDRGQDPADAIAHLSCANVELVMVRGRVQLARTPILERLPLPLRNGLEAIEIDGDTVWVRGPVAQMFASASAVLGNEFLLGNRRVRHADTH